MYLIINISLFICNRRVRHISLVNFGFAIVASTSSLRDQSVCTIAMCGLWLLLQFTLVVVALNIVVCTFAAATSSFLASFPCLFIYPFHQHLPRNFLFSLKCYVYLFSSKIYIMKVCGSFVLLGILYMEHELWTVTLHLKWKMMILEEFEILFCYTTYSNVSFGKHQEYLYS